MRITAKLQKMQEKHNAEVFKTLMKHRKEVEDIINKQVHISLRYSSVLHL